MNCVVLKMYAIGFKLLHSKIRVAILLHLFVVGRGQKLDIPREAYACAIEKALVGKPVSLRDNRCGVCMSSMRSGRCDMVRDLLRGAVRAPLRKLSLEVADMFTRRFGIVLVIFLIRFILVHALI